MDVPAPAHRVIAVVAGKGGVGATTVAVNLAALAGRERALVAIADACPERGQLAAYLGVASGRAPRQGAQPPPGGAVREQLLGLLLPLDDTVRVLTGFPLNGEVLGHLRVLFDVTLVDCPAGTREVAALAAASDEVLIVSSLMRPALEEAAAVRQALRGAGVREERMHLLLNRTESNVAVERADAAALIGTAAIAQLPYDAALVSNAVTTGRPFVVSDASADITRRLRAAAARLGVIAPSRDVAEGQPSAGVGGDARRRERRLRFGLR